MGKLLILAVLIVTIPRWSGAFLPIDRFVLWGIPITAVGTGVTIGLGVFYIIETLQLTNAHYRDRLAKWETHDKNMAAQNKTNHKPKPEPSRSRVWLGLFFGILLALTTLSQTPYIMSELTGIGVNELIGVKMLWGYSVVLVLSPEIIVAAVALAAHERGAMKDGKGTSNASLSNLRDRVLSRIMGSMPEDVSKETEDAKESANATMLVCFCGWNKTTSKRGMNSHMRRHVSEAKAQGTATRAYKWFVETYPDAYNGGEYDVEPPTRETIERWMK